MVLGFSIKLYLKRFSFKPFLERLAGKQFLKRLDLLMWYLGNLSRMLEQFIKKFISKLES